MRRSIVAYGEKVKRRPPDDGEDAQTFSEPPPPEQGRRMLLAPAAEIAHEADSQYRNDRNQVLKEETQAPKAADQRRCSWRSPARCFDLNRSRGRQCPQSRRGTDGERRALDDNDGEIGSPDAILSLVAENAGRPLLINDVSIRTRNRTIVLAARTRRGHNSAIVRTENSAIRASSVFFFRREFRGGTFLFPTTGPAAAGAPGRDRA